MSDIWLVITIVAVCALYLFCVVRRNLTVSPSSGCAGCGCAGCAANRGKEPACPFPACSGEAPESGEDRHAG